MINIIWNIGIIKQEYRGFDICSVYTTPSFTPEHEGWINITDMSKKMFMGIHAGEYSHHKQVLRTDDNPINLWRYALTYWVRNKETIEDAIETTRKHLKELKREIYYK